MELREYIACLSILYDGSWTKIADAIKRKITPPHFHIQDSYITIYDDAYPSSLKKLRYPPWVLFYEGDITLLSKPMATIIGSRIMSDDGKKNTQMATDILKRKYVIVSGLAKGVDGYAHTCAISGGKTIGVIGSGLKTHYPKCNEYLYQQMALDHLILSEYPHDTGVQKYHFPWRNRILAALSDVIVVSQAKLHSGTLLTVNEAMALNKDVYCFPYAMECEEGKGCNSLIQDGANIIYDYHQLELLTPNKENFKY